MPPKAPSKRLTHFLCLPLVTAVSRPQLARALKAFRDDIEDDKTPENPNGIPAKAIRPVGTIHLTLGVMSLLTPERTEAALARLRSLDLAELLLSTAPPVPVAAGESTAAPALGALAPLKATLRGLMSMQQPAKTSVLYSAPEDPEGRLHAFCSKLRGEFLDLLEPDNRPLLLHATILNTIYAPAGRKSADDSGSGRGRSRSKLTIDAREILERYSDAVWMLEVPIEKVAICRMGARNVKGSSGDPTDDQEYVVEGEVSMPRLERGASPA
jgi:activating signal cointegrator complex subunit 1